MLPWLAQEVVYTFSVKNSIFLHSVHDIIRPYFNIYFCLLTMIMSLQGSIVSSFNDLLYIGKCMCGYRRGLDW
jgi:hypothetical protein